VATAVVVALLLAGGGGVLIGHQLSHGPAAATGSPGTTAPSITSPPSSSGGGSGGAGSGTLPGTTTPGSGGSATSGSSAAAAAIAKQVDGGLVDINTVLSYQSEEAAGTGMVLTPTGEILTNNHVIEGATSISVTDIGNGRTYSANVVGYDPSEDVAVLQLVGASGLKTVDLGNSSTVAVGQDVVGIGNANGAGGTPSYAAGAVTATDQSITASDQSSGASEQLTGLIETNAAIIPGDSGGPLVNRNGQVLGMDTAGSTGFQFQASATQAYAIPINTADSLAQQILAGSASSTVHIGATAFLGVEVEPASAGGFGSSTSGALIAGVVSGGPASDAGLAVGDTITSVAGQNIASPTTLGTLILGEKPGDSALVTYLTPSGQQATTTVTFAGGPPQ